MKCKRCNKEAEWKSIQYRNTSGKPLLNKTEENLCSDCVQKIYHFEVEESISPYRCDFCKKPLGKKVFRVKQQNGSYKSTLDVKTKTSREYLFCSRNCVYQFHQCERLK